MLSITNLKASVEDKQILNGLNLEVKAGEVHAIMGPNGSGKSTLASVLAGREDYAADGSVTFDGKNLLDMAPEERAHGRSRPDAGQKLILLAAQHLEMGTVPILLICEAIANEKNKDGAQLDN